MFRIIRKNVLGLALLSTGLSPALTIAAAPAPNATYKIDQVIVVKESGKGDRRCIVVSVKKTPDGTISYQVRALDNSEIMTIYERAPQEGGSAVAPKQPSSTDAPPLSPKTQSPSVRLASSAATNPSAMPTNVPSPNAVYGPIVPTVVQPPGVVPVPANSNAMQGLTLPDSLTKPDSSAPSPSVIAPSITIETAPQVAPPIVTVPKAVMPAPAPPTGRVQQPSFFDRLFGRAPTPCNACNTAKAPTASPSPAIASKANPMTITTTEPTMIRLPANPPSMQRGPSEPVSVGFGPTLPMGMPQPVVTNPQPAPLPVYQEPVDPVRQTIAYEQSRTAELKDALKNAERPSLRIVAAEELSTGSRLRSPDVKAALMLAAQDDPAGCVRASCIRCLSQQGLRDESFMTVIVAAQNDKDASVREEAAYALKKATHK